MKKEALLALALVGLSTSPAVLAEAKEKCYGVVKKGMNECGNKSHGCHGGATVDGHEDEWLMVPAGLCNKLGDKPKENCMKLSSDKKVCDSLVESKATKSTDKKKM
ncbi:MAG: hypothetical protein Fur0010_06170 [Bdellovibrio sp.]